MLSYVIIFRILLLEFSKEYIMAPSQNCKQGYLAHSRTVAITTRAEAEVHLAMHNINSFSPCYPKLKKPSVEFYFNIVVFIFNII